MSIEKWEIIYCPSEKDKNRWRVKLRIEEQELMPLINSLPGTVGRPLLLEGDDFTFGFYIYEIGERDLEDFRLLLQSQCAGGKFVGPSKDEALDTQLDRMARSAAKKGPEAPFPSAVTAAEIAAAGELPEGLAAQSATAPSYPDLTLSDKYTFEEFIIGPNNRFTAAAAQAVADNPGKIYNPFFIYGGVGLGKTHLMHAVGHYVRRKNRNTRILYVTTEKFMSEVIDSIRRGTLQHMRDHYREIDLLLVDDIQFLVESESTQEEFFHTFNVLHQNGKQIIITSDRPPKQLTTLEDRLRSRFEWGLIADIKSPNLETRVAILKKKEEHEHLNLDDNILLYIASKLKSNIRELEGFLKRINAYASLTHQEVNMALVQSIMSDLLPEEERDEQPLHSQTLHPFTEPAPSVPPKPRPEPPPAPAPVPPPVSRPAAAPPVPPPAPLPRSEPPAPPAPMAPRPSAPPAPPAARPAAANDPSEFGLKAVEVAFFYPDGRTEELEKVKERFREVIRKHKLKFRLDPVFERAYVCDGRVNYAFFPELCRTNNVTISIVLGPPPESGVEPEEFSNLLSTVMDDESISLQLVSWAELNKDYRYLNLALDITLLKHRA